MALYAIGDVQGCDAELGALLGALKSRPIAEFSCGSSRLWSTAGPRFAQSTAQNCALGDAATVILGNHDLHLLAVALRRRAACATTIPWAPCWQHAIDRGAVSFISTCLSQCNIQMPH